MCVRKIIPNQLNPFYWRKAAYHDTHGFRNRAWLFDKAAGLYKHKKHTWDFVLLYLDLRNFRLINNKFSHSDGNKVLVKFYELLEKQFRTAEPPKDFKIQRNTPEKDILIVREGGDEFVVLLPLGICDNEKRTIAINAIKERIENLKVEHKGVTITARVAMVCSSPSKNYASFSSFFLAADKKLSDIHKQEN